MTRVAALALALAAAAALPAAANAQGEPRVQARAQGAGFNRTLVVNVQDPSGKPVSGATVKARTEMTTPHVMRLLTRTVPEQAPGTYRLPYTFVMPGDWKVEFEVDAANLEKTTTTLDVPIGVSAAPPPGTTTALPPELDTTVTGRDWLSMAMLWLHSIAALGWIVGVIAMAIALATPALLETGIRARIADEYRRWGAWVHWAAVPVIVGTGIYNMVYVTPFDLRWPWNKDLGLIEYGKTYEAILIVKLGLFVLLVATGTAMLVRIVRTPAPASPSPQGPARTLIAALGVSGVVYLLTIPAILGAAMALRYVHILSHVAEVING